MKKDDKTFTDILLENNRYLFLKEYLELNKNEILKALSLKASNKAIFETVKIQTGLNIKYCNFVIILSKFKEKYIYNLSEAEYKEQMKAISQAATATPEKKSEIKQPEILAAKISESEQPAQPKEPEKVETKKYVPADEKPSGMSKEEKLLKIQQHKQRLLSRTDKNIDIQKNQEKFIWNATIIE